MNQPESSNKAHQAYKKKITKISTKIEKWHKERTQTKKGTFDADDEFISIGNSPSKFESGSEEDQNTSRTRDILESNQMSSTTPETLISSVKKSPIKSFHAPNVKSFSFNSQTDRSSGSPSMPSFTPGKLSKAGSPAKVAHMKQGTIS